MHRMLLAMALAMGLSACASTAPVPTGLVAVSEEPEPAWMAQISVEDRARLDRLPEIWGDALDAVPARQRGTVLKEGDLLVARAARDHAAPPPGSYRCRLVRLGQPAARREPSVRSYADFFCYVRAEQGGGLSFTKQTGTELPGGWLHVDGDRRMVLVGAMQHKAGDNSLAYGTEPDRDLVGVVERVGPFRWRLVLPWRSERAGVDVYELTPVPPDQQVEEPMAG